MSKAEHIFHGNILMSFIVMKTTFSEQQITNGTAAPKTLEEKKIADLCESLTHMQSG